jgi:hypothetical protein
VDALRRYAVARSLFEPTSLHGAIQRLGFVQADPIRAPARAQDLTLRHRVAGYVAGELERRYAELDVEEDFFVNYGFLPRASHALMHPRDRGHPWGRRRTRQALEVVEFVRERGQAHPREVDARFAHGRVTNWFGGSSNATTQLLDALHYRGSLRVARRENGVRVYAVREATAAPTCVAERRERLDALVDVAVRKYAPLPAQSLAVLVGRIRFGAPQFRGGLRAALARAKERLAHERVDAVDWYWPADEAPALAADAPPDEVGRVGREGRREGAGRPVSRMGARQDRYRGDGGESSRHGSRPGAAALPMGLLRRRAHASPLDRGGARHERRRRRPLPARRGVASPLPQGQSGDGLHGNRQPVEAAHHSRDSCNVNRQWKWHRVRLQGSSFV